MSHFHTEDMPAVRPGVDQTVPQSMAERLGPELTAALNLALAEHPDLAAAFLPGGGPVDMVGITVHTWTNNRGSFGGG